MNRDLNWHWTSNGVRKHLMVRYWRGYRPLYSIFRWLMGLPWSDPPEINLRTFTRDNGTCYCPVGMTTRFYVSAFGFGIRARFTRDPTHRPCHCDKVMWLMFPDGHEDDIEEYGLDRLRAEYPGVDRIDAETEKFPVPA